MQNMSCGYLLLLIVTLLVIHIESKPIALVTPDSTNTKLKLHDNGLKFLSDLTGPIAVVSVNGRAKTGKSFMLNQLLGVSDKRAAFPVGIFYTPGTRGLLLWDEPQYVDIPNCKKSATNSCKLTVVYMDAEGLGAPGSPVESYDPKICTLSVLISSLMLYNTYHDISMADVSLLHHVVALSSLLETPNFKFPFPPILWTVQQFEHELGVAHSPEDVLRSALTEAKQPDPSHENPEIKKFNETVRLVTTHFPDLGSPRIMLMHRPHPAKMSQLPEIHQSEFKQEYRDQIVHMRQLIKDRLRPKEFADYLPGEMSTGLFLATLVERVVATMNQIESTNVGATLVRQFSLQLEKRCLGSYFETMNNKVPLPQEDSALIRVHNEASHSSFDMFKNGCAGGLTKFGNDEIYQDLQTTIEEWFVDHLKNNTAVAQIQSNTLVNSLFGELWHEGVITVDTFDQQLYERKQQYKSMARGPKHLVDEPLQIMLARLETRRMFLLSREAGSDLKSIVWFCVPIAVGSYLFMQVLVLFERKALPLLVCNILMAFSILTPLYSVGLHNGFISDGFISFEHIQIAYRFLRRNYIVFLLQMTFLLAIPILLLKKTLSPSASGGSILTQGVKQVVEEQIRLSVSKDEKARESTAAAGPDPSLRNITVRRGRI